MIKIASFNTSLKYSKQNKSLLKNQFFFNFNTDSINNIYYLTSS